MMENGDAIEKIEVSENNEGIETSQKERKPRSRERGQDRKPRTIRANSMRNLNQFSDKPEEFSTYLKDEKGIDITGNTNATTKIVLIVIGIMLAGLGVLYFYDRYKNKHDNQEYWK